MAAALAGALLVAGCGRAGPGPAPRKPDAPSEKAWTEDDMATNPEGYLTWAGQRLAAQIKDREERVAELGAKRKAIAADRDKFVGDYQAVQNLESRLATATRRADEEDRWPVTIAGKPFSKEQAAAVLAESRQFLEERKALAAAYESAITRIDMATKDLRADVSRLQNLQTTVKLDLERVKIDRSRPDVEKLRKTEAEIAHYSKVIAADDVNVEALPKAKFSADLQSMLH